VPAFDLAQIWCGLVHGRMSPDQGRHRLCGSLFGLDARMMGHGKACAVGQNGMDHAVSGCTVRAKVKKQMQDIFYQKK